MGVWFYSLIAIIVLALTLLVFAFTPFVCKKLRKGMAIFILVFLIIITLIPSSLISNIHLPIINSSIGEFSKMFLLKSEKFTNIANFDPSILDKVTKLISGIVKMSFTYITLSMMLIFSEIAFFIIHLIKSRKKMLKVTSGVLFILVMSFMFSFIPVYSLVNINYKMRVNLSKDNDFLQSHPEYREYEKIFNLLDRGNILIDSSLDISDFILGFSVLSSGGYSNLIEELDSIDGIIELSTQAGLPHLYEEDFDFSKTSKDTFDFDKVKVIISRVLKSNIYDDMARLYANNIMKSLQDLLKDREPRNKELQLEMSSDEFKNQYGDLIDLLKFVADYNLINRLSDISLANMQGLIEELDINAFATLTKLSSYPLIVKIQEYLGTKTVLIASIYACLVLYDALNNWFENYKLTPMYDTIGKFLSIKGVISYES